MRLLGAEAAPACFQWAPLAPRWTDSSKRDPSMPLPGRCNSKCFSNLKQKEVPSADLCFDCLKGVHRDANGLLYSRMRHCYLPVSRTMQSWDEGGVGRPGSPPEGISSEVVGNGSVGATGRLTPAARGHLSMEGKGFFQTMEPLS